jgi:hypothetical protein
MMNAVVVAAVPGVGRLVGLGPQQQQQFAADGTTATTATTTHIEGMEALQQQQGGGGGGGGDYHFEEEEDDMTENEKQMKEEELTFYSSTQNDHGDDNIWGLLSGVGGNVYEWYVRNTKMAETLGRSKNRVIFGRKRMIPQSYGQSFLLCCYSPPLPHRHHHLHIYLPRSSYSYYCLGMTLPCMAYWLPRLEPRFFHKVPDDSSSSIPLEFI